MGKKSSGIISYGAVNAYIWQGKDRERGGHRECIHTHGPLKRGWTG